MLSVPPSRWSSAGLDLFGGRRPGVLCVAADGDGLGGCTTRWRAWRARPASRWRASAFARM